MLALILLPQPQPWGRLLRIRICRFGPAGNVYVLGQGRVRSKLATVPKTEPDPRRGDSAGGRFPVWARLDRPEPRGDFRVPRDIASRGKAR
jgi:hypothetical protein